MRLAVLAYLVLFIWLAALHGNVSAEVKGKWLTDRDKALSEAQKVKKPILAVAMDHG
ncbi:MAG: hypothetical protein WC712_10130 [Candidatus Brocadiia bacterium]